MYAPVTDFLGSTITSIVIMVILLVIIILVSTTISISIANGLGKPIKGVRRSSDSAAAGRSDLPQPGL